MTVAEIVREKQEKQEAYIKKDEAQRKRKATIQHKKDFEACVQTVIHNFENRFFSAEDSEEKVAEVIMGLNSRIIVETTGIRYSTLKYYGCIERGSEYRVNYMESVKFSESDHSGKTLITNHKGFCEWKDYLEKKFGVKIYINRSYTYKERDEAPSDRIFIGIRAQVTLQKGD